MITPIQELIEELPKHSKGGNTLYDAGYTEALYMVKQMCEKLFLEKEREEIIKAHGDQCYGHGYYVNGSEYYKSRFNGE